MSKIGSFLSSIFKKKQYSIPNNIPDFITGNEEERKMKQEAYIKLGIRFRESKLNN